MTVKPVDAIAVIGLSKVKKNIDKKRSNVIETVSKARRYMRKEKL